MKTLLALLLTTMGLHGAGLTPAFLSSINVPAPAGGAVYTTNYTDDFTASADPLGGSWTTITGQGAMRSVVGIVEPSNSTGDAGSVYSGGTFATNQWCEADITTLGTGGGGQGIGLAVRAVTNSFYRLVMDGSGSSNMELGKIVNGSFTSLATRTVTYVDGQVLRLEVSGTTLKIIYNGSQVGATVSDNAILSGKPGLAYSSLATSSELDNWKAGDAP
jgi:hypothetical protein